MAIDMSTMKLSDLSDAELAMFYILANSHYAVKRHRVAGGEVEIQNINEIENEMSNRSIEYWNSKMKEAQAVDFC